jgi:beta-barrel assembly-enhancing protease
MRRNSRLMIALVLAAFALLSYWSSKETNPITKESQAIAMSPEQEVALGLQSAPQMAAEFGGVVQDPALQSAIESIGQRLVRESRASGVNYQYSFRVLADQRTVNAFALPGGPIFITLALLSRLENEGQLAGVVGHEIGHVVGRHASERIAKSSLFEQLIQAVAIGASDTAVGGQNAAVIAQQVAQLKLMSFGREDELQSDTLGVEFMSEAGYDPRAMIKVMDILEQASGGSGQPEFMSTHPDPGNRRQVITQEIQRLFPNGVPSNLTLGRPIR